MAETKVGRFSGVKDRLSTLPDDILIHNILSRLPMEEAARTSILARRWRLSWVHVADLDFDASEEIVRTDPDQRPIFFQGGGEAASKYVERVDQVISACIMGNATKLRRFRVVFPLDSSDTFAHKIKSWLEFCLDKGIEVLELDGVSELATDTSSLFRFPLLHNPGSLKSLTLKGLCIADDTLKHILLGCKLLERLHLHELEDLTCVNVTTAPRTSSRLKSIRVTYCYLSSITISAPTPDLVSFVCNGWVRNLHIEHAPRLLDLVIGQQGNLTSFDLLSHPLFHYVAQLDSLCLELLSWEMVMQWLPYLPVLSRLKNLRLGLVGSAVSFEMMSWPQKLHGLASLIKAAQCVQHLTLEVHYLPSNLQIEEEEFANLHLQHLRVIEITGFQGRGPQYALALQLIKSAVSLEKLIVDFRDPALVGCATGEEYPDSKAKTEEMKSHAREVIGKELPPKVKLVLI